MNTENPKDATVAAPPSTESATSEHPYRTPGLGKALTPLPSDPSPQETDPEEHR